MNKILMLAAVPALFTLGACERRDHLDRDARDGVATTEREIEADRDIDVDVQPGDIDADYTKSYKTETEIEKRGLGEGEKETMGGLNRGSEKNDTGLSNEQIINSFAADLMSDPDIAAHSQATISVEDDGDLVLRGTAETRELGDELHDYAVELAGRAVNNELVITND